MPTKTTATLWADTNGAIWCADHGGSYLAGAIAAHPNRTTHTTPLTTWEKVSPAEIAELAAIVGPDVSIGCDACNRKDTTTP